MIIKSLTRMWLTRSIKPFIFLNHNDSVLSFEQCESLGLYIHIPFCRQICSFCPYCKVIYQEETCNRYIDALLREITLVGSRLTQKKKVTSLYFGGGTPVLVVDRLDEIIRCVNKYFVIEEGIGIELHPDDVREDILKELKNAGITKISIGIQSFQDKFLDVLGRKKFDYSSMSQALEKVPFETVSMDFIFALPGQTKEDIIKDISIAYSHGANHIAIYPFIEFSFASKKIPKMKKKEKKKLLDEITEYCKEKGYRRDSIWTFSNNETAKYSSMTRENFLGFGCSATTLLEKQFKINTFHVDEYIKQIEKETLPTALTIHFTRRQRMVYYLFWETYSMQVDSEKFEHFFHESLSKLYGMELRIAEGLKFITRKGKLYEMTPKGAFYYHYYEGYYTLAYIDKMWSVMRKVAFPKKIQLK